MNIKNRIEIDFDAMPDHMVSALAQSLEQYIAQNHPEVALHGSCSTLDEESLTHEVATRAWERHRKPVHIATPIADAIRDGARFDLDETVGTFPKECGE